jgi:hypothetical protein
MKSSWNAIAVVAFLLVGERTQGMDLYTYDLDSLVYMSPRIVEGKIVGQHRQNNFDVWEIEISTPHVGGFAVGQKINVTALDYYRVSDKGDWNSEKLKRNDELFLFLDRAKSTFLYDIPTNAEIYWPAPSGVRFISRGKAVGFWQWDNPGPYVADTARAETNLAVPTITEFRRQIRESIGRVEQWNQLLKKKATSENIPALLALLRERSAPGNGFRERDDIAETVCKQLADLKNPQALLEATRIPKFVGFEESFTLGKGLATPAGRDLLVTKIADDGELLSDRIKWARLLGEATSMVGPATFFESADNAKNRPENEHYLKKIAELATREQTDTNLQVQLLTSLRWMAGVSSSGELVITDDGREAESILESFWKRTDSEQLKYDAEIILYALSRTQTNSEFGPIVAILKPANYYHSGKSLGYDLEYTSYQKGSWTAKIALENLNTGKKTNFDMPANQQINGNSQGSSGNSIVIPADFPHGRYRVFAEFFDGEKVVTASHYFETDL